MTPISREDTILTTDLCWSKPHPNPVTGCSPLPPRNEPLLYIPTPDSHTTPCLKLLMVDSELAHLQAVSSSSTEAEGMGLDQVTPSFQRHHSSGLYAPVHRKLGNKTQERPQSGRSESRTPSAWLPLYKTMLIID
jgi:hypothetical protein